MRDQRALQALRGPAESTKTVENAEIAENTSLALVAAPSETPASPAASEQNPEAPLVSAIPTAAEFTEKSKRDLLAWQADIDAAKLAAPSLGYNQVETIRSVLPLWARTVETGRKIYGLDQSPAAGSCTVNVGILGQAAVLSSPAVPAVL